MSLCLNMTGFVIESCGPYFLTLCTYTHTERKTYILLMVEANQATGPDVRFRHPITTLHPARKDSVMTPLPHKIPSASARGEHLHGPISARKAFHPRPIPQQW